MLAMNYIIIATPTATKAGIIVSEYVIFICPVRSLTRHEPIKRKYSGLIVAGVVDVQSV